eukprot:349997_1
MVMCVVSLSSLLLWVVYVDIVNFTIFNTIVVTAIMWYSAYFPEITFILINYVHLMELTLEMQSFHLLLRRLFVTDNNDYDISNYDVHVTLDRDQYLSIINSDLTALYHQIYNKKETFLTYFRLRFFIDFLMLIMNSWMLLDIVLNSAFGFANANYAAGITQISFVMYYIVIISFIFTKALDMEHKYQQILNTCQVINDISLSNHRHQILQDKEYVIEAQCVNSTAIRLLQLAHRFPLYYDIFGYSIKGKTIARGLFVFFVGKLISYLLTHGEY